MSSDWYWEGNVVASVARHLERNSWTVDKIADTASRQTGVDIEAHRGEQTLLIEAKGFPSDVYARGPKKGQTKSALQTVQARVWFGDVLLAAILRQAAHPSAEVGIALPAFETYRKLLDRTALAFCKLGISVFLVGETGDVTETRNATSPAENPLIAIAGKHSGDEWEDLLETIQKNRQE